jgi:hypothetical protein
MSRATTVVGIYSLPAALDVTPDCFSKTFQVTIGGLDAKITLPRIEWNADKPRIVAPLMASEVKRYADQYVVDRLQGWEKYDYWGSVNSYQPENQKVLRSYLGAILLEYKRDTASMAYSDYLYGRGHPVGTEIDRLFDTIDSWFEQLRTWVETAIDQDVDPIDSVLASKLHGAGLHVFTIEGSIVSLPATAFHMSVKRSTFESVSLTLLRKIIKLVNAGIMPTDAQSLLRDSKSELRRGRYRRAVIDAGSATEITLADFNNRVTHIYLGSRPTLGQYIAQPKIATEAKLPPNIKADLVDIRNRAIHQNQLPSHAEAKLALEIAKQVVDRLDPLPL